MKHRHAFVLAASVLGCGGSHTSPQNPAAPFGSVATNVAPPAAPTPAAPSHPPMAASNATTATASPSSTALPVTVSTAKAHTEGHHYVLDFKAPATLSLGGAGELEIVLLAKDGYHVNDEFPYKLRTAVEPAGTVTFEKAEYVRSDGSYTKTEARFRARFAGAKVGEAKIGGVLALSVCTPKECVTDKVELEVLVTVR